MRLSPHCREGDANLAVRAELALRSKLVDRGYTHVMGRGSHLCGIRRMETGTWGVYVHLDVSGHDRHYCFEHQADAINCVLPVSAHEFLGSCWQG